MGQAIKKAGHPKAHEKMGGSQMNWLKNNGAVIATFDKHHALYDPAYIPNYNEIEKEKRRNKNGDGGESLRNPDNNFGKYMGRVKELEDRVLKQEQRLETLYNRLGETMP